MLREKFKYLIDRLGAIEKKDLAADIETIIDSCGEYIEKVNAMEAAITVARYMMEPEDYRVHIIELEKSRKLYHNALIANIKLLNRYCRLAEVEEIYTSDIDSRIEIAEFAMEIVNEMFKTRKF